MHFGIFTMQNPNVRLKVSNRIEKTGEHIVQGVSPGEKRFRA